MSMEAVIVILCAASVLALALSIFLAITVSGLRAEIRQNGNQIGLARDHFESCLVNTRQHINNVSRDVDDVDERLGLLLDHLGLRVSVPAKPSPRVIKKEGEA